MGRDARATWAKRVERWSESGLPAAEFAAEIGVNARTLTYWKWKLGRPEQRRAAPKPEFVEVVPAASSSTSDVAPPDSLEEVLGGGVVIPVPPRCDADPLRPPALAVELRVGGHARLAAPIAR